MEDFQSPRSAPSLLARDRLVLLVSWECFVSQLHGPNEIRIYLDLKQRICVILFLGVIVFSFQGSTHIS
jgi:hypothetical protein